jgi:hypothetical protein
MREESMDKRTIPESDNESYVSLPSYASKLTQAPIPARTRIIKTLGSLTLFDTCCYITRSFVLSYSFQTDHRRHLAIEQFRQLPLYL